jgi:prophage DNA circulation protein
MSTIKDIHRPFRDAWVPASFRGAAFFVESNSRDSGRRIITHEFPKKDLPYSEDMGRKAKIFSIRAYCVTAVKTLAGQNANLYNVDYRIVRDALIAALEAPGPGTLVLSTLPQENVVVSRYRLNEEERFGGYCTFDIEFAEYGVPPQYLTPSQNTNAALNGAADALRSQIAAGKAGPEPIQGAPVISNPTQTQQMATPFKERFGSWPQLAVTFRNG